MLGCTAKTLRKYLKQNLVEEEGAEDAVRLLSKCSTDPGVFLELLLHLARKNAEDKT